VHINATIKRFRATIVAVEQQYMLRGTYIEGVSVDLGIQHAMRVRHIVISSLPGSKIFFPIVSLTAVLLKNVIDYKRCVLIFSANFLRNISHSKKK
jgi:hypothetical protein